MNTPSVDVARLRAWCAIALLFALLMLPNLIWLHFEHGVQTWMEALLLPVALLVLLFAILGELPWLTCLLLAPFAALAPLEAWYVSVYHHPVSPDVLATIVATNPREAREYLGPAMLPLAIFLLAGLTVALLAAWLSQRAHLHWRNRWRTWILIIGLSLPFASAAVAFATTHGDITERFHDSDVLLTSLEDPVASGYPFGLFQRVAEYHREWTAMRAGAARLDEFRFHARRIDAPRQRQVYVLVIGEASRRDHWQLFGYDRPTNPGLSQVANLVPIPDMLTSWPESIDAIPMILTRKPPAMRWSLAWREASILRAMQEAGFETYWISNQLAIGKYDSPVSIYAYEARHVVWLNHASWAAPGSYDEDLLQPLRDALRDSGKDLFIVLHMMGSHQSYDFRYPRAFARFKPTIADGGGEAGRNERVRNSYDNTILYTDRVLTQAIGILRGSGAITALWFESDHGETLPNATCGKEGHGIGTRYEFQIPALFWYSDAYASAFPQRVSTLRENAGKRTLSADTFESIIDMSGVDFAGHDPSWSLFSAEWRYRPRTVHVLWQTDYDKAAFGKGCEVVLPSPSEASAGP
ncbi:MAG: sulfatase-like hydrolase/transferase [Proteobacteria bacterium]|nr:sulfatase-like hydrolase/transferase [Pseudomonadota bacterium]